MFLCICRLWRMSAILPALILLPAAAQNATSGWMKDASTAPIPVHPVRGVLFGSPFMPDHIVARPTWEESGDTGAPKEKMERVEGICLEMRQGDLDAAHRQITLFLMAPRGHLIDGRRYLLTPAGLWDQPDKIMDRDGRGWFYPVGGVHLSESRPGAKSSDDLFPQVTMRLVLGRRRAGKLPGQIYLSSKQPRKSWIAGTFEAVLEPR